jgi:two-component system NarL family sensor kinase
MKKHKENHQFNRLETENHALKEVRTVEERVRARMAQDLHDGIGQHISVMLLCLGIWIDRETDPVYRRTLEGFYNDLTVLIEEIQQVCANLAPYTLEKYGLLAALDEFRRSIAFSGIDISIQTPPVMPALPSCLQTDVYRIVQEFLANAIRHGKATHIDIEFVHEETVIRVTLKENGIGFDMGIVQRSGMGLRNVRSRVQAHRGQFQIKSAPGEGTAYFIFFPIKYSNNCHG